MKWPDSCYIAEKIMTENYLYGSSIAKQITMLELPIKNRGKHVRAVLHLRSSGGLLGAENVLLEIAKHSLMFSYISVIGVLADTRDDNSELLTAAEENGLISIVFECSGKVDLKCAKQIKEYIINNRIQVLHCHGYKENIYGVLSGAGIPKLATNHLWKTNSFLLRIYRLLDSITLRNYDTVTGVSSEILLEMQKFGLQNPIKVPNGIDCNKFIKVPKNEKLAKSFGLPRAKRIYGMISSLTYEKNHAIVLDSLARLKSDAIQLLIVGDGPLRTSLQAMTARLGLENKIIFVGRQENIVQILSLIDVFLLPSKKEGLPMALLEAMSCCKAVIASRVGENPRVIEHNVNGILIEPDNSSSLIQAMNFFIDFPEKIEEFGLKARKTVEDKYSAETMTRNYCRLYDHLTGAATT